MLCSHRAALPSPNVDGNNTNIQVRYRGASATFIASLPDSMTPAMVFMMLHCDSTVEVPMQPWHLCIPQCTWNLSYSGCALKQQVAWQ